jgi:hypothetical protein
VAVTGQVTCGSEVTWQMTGLYVVMWQVDWELTVPLTVSSTRPIPG